MSKTALLLSTLLLVTIAPTAQAADANLKVMSRNIYLGADVGVAMKLIPDFKAAAQFMWDQVAATDFSKRAPLLAKEIITNKADVVGIQEATTWICKKIHGVEKQRFSTSQTNYWMQRRNLAQSMY